MFQVTPDRVKHEVQRRYRSVCAQFSIETEGFVELDSVMNLMHDPRRFSPRRLRVQVD